MESTTAPKPFCFVLMPFNKEFDDTYMLGIKQACDDAGAYCERVDEQIFTESILERVYNQISKADIIIADMSTRNPNVFYEVGYAHALGKTTILLTNKAEDIPFDLKHYTHIIYSNITQLKEELTQRVKWFIQNIDNDEKEYTINFDLYLGKKKLSNEEVVFDVNKGSYPDPHITLHNNSLYTYSPGEYKIGVITEKEFNFMRNRESKSIMLPNGHMLHILPYFEEILYPDMYIEFVPILGYREISDEQKITIRLFTSAGYRDFPLTIKFIKGSKEEED